MTGPDRAEILTVLLRVIRLFHPTQDLVLRNAIGISNSGEISRGTRPRDSGRRKVGSSRMIDKRVAFPCDSLDGLPERSIADP